MSYRTDRNMSLSVSENVLEVDVSAADQTLTPSAAIYVGVTGDLDVTLVGGTRDIFKNVPVGFLPLRVLTVHNAGTTATELLAVW